MKIGFVNQNYFIRPPTIANLLTKLSTTAIILKMKTLLHKVS